MLPVEVRVLPTFDEVTKLGMLNTYAGLNLCRADDPADRLGHGNLRVPAVLSDPPG